MNSKDRLGSIVIAGNDIHGWAVAARLARALRGQSVEITIIDPNHAAFPSVLSLSTGAHDFHTYLGVQEVDLLKNVGGVYKYGTRFQNCREAQDEIFSYSPTGELIDRVKFHHYLSRQKCQKCQNRSVNVSDYSIASSAALANKFSHPEPNSVLHKLDYSFQVDGVRYLHFLAQFALHYGVKRIEADVDGATINDHGFIESLSLSNGATLNADFFIDATGAKASIIEGALGISYTDWTQTFGSDRRLEMIVADNSETPLFNTVSKAEHGWFQSIPIQGARHCHFSFNSTALSDEQAREFAFSEFGKPIREDLVRLSEQRQGMRETFWQANCLAIGESAGFIDALLFSPLDFTINAIERWLAAYPERDCNRLLAEEYNMATQNEYHRVADVHAIIADSELERRVFSASVEHRVELFRSTGQVAFYEFDVLSEAQWINLFLAFDIWPEFYDPLINAVSDSQIVSLLTERAAEVANAVARLPKHDQLLQAIQQATKNSAEPSAQAPAKSD